MRTLLVGLLVVALAFAGCTSKDKDSDAEPTTSSSTSSTTSATTSSSGTSTTSSTTTSTGPAPTPNRAPTGSISAVVNGTRVDFNLTGIDADDDALTWTLSFGDGNSTNGATLPATVNHTYSAGNYSAVFNLTDGTDTASYNVSLAIVAGAAGGTAQVITVGWQIGVSDAGAFPEIFSCTAGPGAGVTHGVFTVAEGSFGVPFVATIADMSEGAAIVGWGLLVSDPGCGAEDFVSFSAEGAGTITGTVPAGYSFGLATSDGGVEPEVTITFG